MNRKRACQDENTEENISSIKQQQEEYLMKSKREKLSIADQADAQLDTENKLQEILIINQAKLEEYRSQKQLQQHPSLWLSCNTVRI